MSAHQMLRLVDDSRGRPPRTLIRVFVPAEDFDASVAFYEKLLDTTADGMFPFPAARLKLATVGRFS